MTSADSTSAAELILYRPGHRAAGAVRRIHVYLDERQVADLALCGTGRAAAAAVGRGRPRRGGRGGHQWSSFPLSFTVTSRRAQRSGSPSASAWNARSMTWPGGTVPPEAAQKLRLERNTPAATAASSPG